MKVVVRVFARILAALPRGAAFVLAAAVAGVVGDAGAVERRVALVVGNAGYEHAPALANPRNDAADVSALLREFGFEVAVVQDADLRQLSEAVRAFAASIPGADIALFYYAGHALQVGERNYLVPRDAEIAQSFDVPLRTLELGTVIAAMETGARASIIFLDACRENPFANALRFQGRSLSKAGLAKTETGVGTLVGYATAPGTIAADGSGRNSPFTAAFLKAARIPGLEIQQVMKRVRADVIGATAGRQVPWENSSLIGDVYLGPRDAPAAGPAPTADPGSTPAPARPEIARAPTGEPTEAELMFWRTTERLNSAQGYRDYLRRFGDGGFFRGPAEEELRRLSGDRPAARRAARPPPKPAPVAQRAESRALPARPRAAPRSRGCTALNGQSFCN